MKLIHLSDLHLGKRVNELSMLEDQKYILHQIVTIVEREKPEGVLIAGDVYDKSIPPVEAVQLFDEFLNALVGLGVDVYVISGNHDSAERISFGARLMEKEGIYISPVYDGNVEVILKEDEYGEVGIYLVPFVKPVHVRKYFPEEEVESYTQGLQVIVDNLEMDVSRRNVMVTHQFVTGASRSESESISVGGSDNVDAGVFDGFDYVSLGHIHGPQNMGKETIRYCGTPLKYSFSEANHVKSVTVVELKEKGNVDVRTVELHPLHDMKEIKGSYMELTAKSYYDGLNRDDYYHITLTEEEDILDAMGKLRVIYPNLMRLDYDNKRTRSQGNVEVAVAMEEKSPIQLFGEFYEKQNNQEMGQEQETFVAELMENIWEKD